MSSSRTIAITGASGLVGRALAESLLADGHTVRRLVRRAARDPRHEVRWDPTAGQIDAAGLEGVDAVVHLAGENIAGGRWNAQRKRRIIDSRVDGTRTLCRAIAGLESKPEVLVSASATGFYGNRGDEPVDEDSPAGAGFLAETCVAWEAETRPAWEAEIRVVQMRIGLVLSPDGGLLGKVLPLFKFGLGSVLGSGRQYMSWITLADLVRALRLAIDNPALHGAVNGVAPNPATNREFTKTLGRVLGRPTPLPAPAFALKLVAGEMADEMLLGGVRVLPTRLQQAGFEFQSPDLESALRRVLGR